jgi:DNA-binding NarL/FixJ family response regulator
MERPIKVLIADDHDLIFSGLEVLLGDTSQYTILQHCKTLEQARQYVLKQEVDLLITDLHFTEGTGIALVLEVKKHKMKQKVLMLTLEEDPSYIREAVNAGVDGYILKGEDNVRLKGAIEQLITVGEYFSPNVTRILSQHTEKKPITHTDEVFSLSHYRLTPKEQEVLLWIAKAKNNAEIMNILNIEASTLSSHRTSLYSKVGVSTDVGLSMFAFKYGLIKMNK